MSGKATWIIAAFLATRFTAGTPANGQSSQPSQQEKPAQSQPGQQPADPSKTGSSLAMPGATANAEEIAAAKAFQEMPNSDSPKKIAAGEKFLKKNPQSPKRPNRY